MNCTSSLSPRLRRTSGRVPGSKGRGVAERVAKSNIDQPTLSFVLSLQPIPIESFYRLLSRMSIARQARGLILYVYHRGVKQFPCPYHDRPVRVLPILEMYTAITFAKCKIHTHTAQGTAISLAQNNNTYTSLANT